MKRLSKSRYTQFCKCQKNLWLNAYKPELAVIDASVENMVKVWKNLKENV